MRKVLIAMLMLCIAGAKAYSASVVFNRDTLEASNTYYLLIDRNYGNYDVNGTTTNDTADYFGHSQDGDKNIELIRYDVNVASNTKEIKIGQIYGINDSTAQIRWIDRYYRETSDDSIYDCKVFDDKLIDVENEQVKADNEVVSIDTSDYLYTYVTNVRGKPAKGDIILYVDSADTATKLDVSIEYREE